LNERDSKALQGAGADQDDLAALASGGRTNVFGFFLRLGARIPFLFIAGRLYGADHLGRFALAVLVVEFAAQLATLGLKRGLAEQLSSGKQPDTHVIFDALLLCLTTSVVVSGALIAFPQAMFPNSAINGLDWLLPLIIFPLAATDIALAACAFRYDIAATVRARSIIEPWTLSIGAAALYLYSARDGLILAYVLSMLAAMLAAIPPLFRHFGLPHGWRPHPLRLWTLARRNLPLAAADAIEWGTRRLDLWILGLFATPAIAGIYYVAQQLASLPQKLKSSFEPILGPVISRNVAQKNYRAIAEQVGQVGFWILAAQIGIALSLGFPGEVAMGVVGPQFTGGTIALAFLLAAEVAASPAVVSEAALVYLARVRNVMMSIGVIAIQALFSVGLILLARQLDLGEAWIAASPAAALALALAIGSLIKGRYLARLTGAPIRTWRLSLVGSAMVASIVGGAFLAIPREMEWARLAIGMPVILIVYFALIWRFGFDETDRTLFRRQMPGMNK